MRNEGDVSRSRGRVSFKEYEIYPRPCRYLSSIAELLLCLSQWRIFFYSYLGATWKATFDFFEGGLSSHAFSKQQIGPSITLLLPSWMKAIAVCPYPQQHMNNNLLTRKNYVFKGKGRWLPKKELSSCLEEKRSEYEPTVILRRGQRIKVTMNEENTGNWCLAILS